MVGDAEFFKEIDLVGLQSGSFEAAIELSKSENMLNLAIDLKGTLALVCDRSLDDFEQPFSSHEKLILKFGDHDEELDNGLRLIHRGTQRISLHQDLLDMVILAVPMKKLHPRFANAEPDNSQGSIVYQTKADKPQQATKPSSDPRWEALKNLKFE
jgi:uncharacterized metal-binding protein YceD (DUF177 family)